MFIYKIRNPSAPPKTAGVTPVSNDESYLGKPAILGRHLNKCYLKIGDRIRMKKPKRPIRYGTLVAAEDNPSKVKWRGETPLFLTVELEKVDRKTGAIYGTESLQVGIKQILFVGMR